MQDDTSLRQRGWSVRTPSLPLYVSFLAFFSFFLIPSARAQVAPGDRSPKLACKCGFGQGGAFWGLDDDQSRLGVLTLVTPKNQNFCGVNRHFKPNLQKKIQIVISSKLCIGLA